MACKGCDLSWALTATGQPDQFGSFTFSGGSAYGSTLPLVSFASGLWGTIQALVLSGATGPASHGLCLTGILTGTTGSCAPALPCEGVRYLTYTTASGFFLVGTSTDANTHQPFLCGDSEYLSFYGATGIVTATGITYVKATTDYTLTIDCNKCK